MRIAPEEPAIQVACALTAAPSIAGDTAAVLFHTPDATREACAQRLVAETLRPWPIASRDPWTVQLTLTPAGATARRLDSDRARDAIDAGPVLMASEDLDLVAYAATRPDLEVAPLPWDRTYLRLSPARESLGAGVSIDAVRVDARQARPWECNAVHGDGPSETASGQLVRILYDAGDRTARELAARIVALSERADMTAVGVSAAELDVLLQAGDDVAYIVSVPSASQCDALAALARKAPWIGAHTVHPLIETRAHSIAPRTVRP